MQFPKPATLVLACLLFVQITHAAFADDPPPNQNQQAVNSGQLVTPALLSIDDKSPMANSIQGINAGDVKSALDSKVTTLSSILGPLISGDPASPRIVITISLPDGRIVILTSTIDAFKIDPKLAPYIGMLPRDEQTVADLLERIKRKQKGVGQYYLAVLAILSALNELPSVKVSVTTVVDNTDVLTKVTSPQVLGGFSIPTMDGDLKTTSFTAVIPVRAMPKSQVYQRAEASSGEDRFDLVFETADAAPRSVSVGARIDVSYSRQYHVNRIGRFAEVRNRSAIAEKSAGPSSLHSLATALALYWGYIDATEAAVAIAKSPHIGITSSFTSVNGIGSLTTMGVSVSALKEFPRFSRGAFTFLGSVQSARLAVTGPGTTTRTVPGVAVMWQDRVSQEYLDDLPAIRRWNYQFGVEYNSLAEFRHIHDVYDVFYRQRYCKFYETKITAGMNAQNRFQLGFEFGYTFAFAQAH